MPDRRPVLGGYGEFSRFYSALWSSDWADRVAPAVLEILRNQTRKRSPSVLDVACGAGHISRFLSSHGCRIAGVDGSTRLLRSARRKVPGSKFACWQIGETIPRSLGKFDAAICVYDSLNHAPDLPTARHVLMSISAALRPNGVVLFDYNAAEGFAKRWRFTVRAERSWGWCEGRFSFDRQRALGVLGVHGVIRTGTRSRRFREQYFEIPFRSRDISRWLDDAGLDELRLPKKLGALLPSDPGRRWTLARKR